MTLTHELDPVKVNHYAKMYRLKVISKLLSNTQMTSSPQRADSMGATENVGFNAKVQQNLELL